MDKNDGDVIESAVQAAGMKFIRVDRGAPYSKTPLTRWLEDCAAWCAGGWRTGTPRLSTLVRTWQGFNPSIRTESALFDLKLALVGFLFSHRTKDRLARDWLGDAWRILLTETLEREPTLRDEKAACANLVRVCGSGAKLADLTVAALGGQAGSSEHLNLITLIARRAWNSTR
jgi:DNA helicase-2/ATP-dependent DNA helicase PcrA